VHFVNFCVVVGAFCEKSLFVVVHLHHAQLFSYLYIVRTEPFTTGLLTSRQQGSSMLVRSDNICSIF
jgi:hypothetical protein